MTGFILALITAMTPGLVSGKDNDPARTCPVNSPGAPLTQINRVRARACARGLAKEKCYAYSQVLEPGVGWVCKRFYANGERGWYAGNCKFGPPLKVNVGVCYPSAHLKARMDNKLWANKLWLDITTFPTGGVTFVQKGETFYISPHSWTVQTSGDIG